jgi:signal transduction histidine kinase
LTLILDITTDIIAYYDDFMIKTVARNLITNAVKFTPFGGFIRITGRQVNQNIEISIEDNGVGIKPDDLTKLFRIDQNHSTIGTSNETGTGLGLILCKEFVEKNGGKIWVESTYGSGSTFHFTLPLDFYN